MPKGYAPAAETLSATSVGALSRALAWLAAVGLAALGVRWMIDVDPLDAF